MLSHSDLSLWYQRLGLPEGARVIIDRIRSSEPARRVGGGKSNVPGRYPSRKMGKTIQFESHRVELAVALEMEEDTTVFEYYDQPCQIPLTYCDGGQRKISVMHTPDFFVLRADSAGWVECKMDKDLVILPQKIPHRYVQTQRRGLALSARGRVRLGAGPLLQGLSVESDRLGFGAECLLPR